MYLMPILSPRVAFKGEQGVNIYVLISFSLLV